MTEREAFEQQYGYRPYNVDMLWDAWERACKWEREACAKIAEQHEEGPGGADAIRDRSNA